MAHHNVGFLPEPPAHRSDSKEEAPNGEEESASAEPSPLDCVICFTPYDQLFKLPKELSCGHIFCLECLARINVSSEDVNAITCPICRAPTVLPPRKGLPGLPTRRNLLEQLTAMPVPPGSVRFDRRRGLLYLPSGNKTGAQLGSKPGPPLNTVSLSVDVGRPPPPGSARRLSVSGWPFYAALSVALLVTVALIVCGIYIFMMPSMYISVGGFPKGNHSLSFEGNHSNAISSSPT
ncbi:LOW QUALITY PROTEIN: RING finger protein 225-like [Erythrolamprus reginae]|uniref:LOW QUALITY PROTEIN: RING finger protein 225-like n=1 Tax=Erythrolamprus reginae TaxID=121349 RepID=UPI00396CAF0A